jgi:hypothetical protein
LASSGALITILAVALSPFFQQALQYYTVYPASGDAFMPIAKYINGTDIFPILQFPKIIFNQLDSAILAAPNLAMFSPVHTNFTVTAQCSTGNCSWDSYQTLAVCNTCKNITSTVISTPVELDPFPITNDGPTGAVFRGNISSFNNYLLPNGLGFTGFSTVPFFGMSLVNITTSPSLNLDFKWDSTTSAFLDDYVYWSSIAFPMNVTGSKILSVYGIGPSPGTVPYQPEPVGPGYSPARKPVFSPPHAFECLLQYCVHNMSAKFVNGQLFETTISTWTNQTQIIDAEGYQDAILNPPGWDDAVIIKLQVTTDLARWLSEFVLKGNVTVPIESYFVPGNQLIISSSNLLNAVFQSMNTSATGFPDHMDNLARSLSLSLRQISYQPTPVQGKAFSTVTRAVVTWEWLILPIFELVASLALLLLVMRKSSRNGLVPWTDDILPVLFHGLDELPQWRHVGENLHDMQHEAHQQLIEFKPHENGGRLALVEP